MKLTDGLEKKLIDITSQLITFPTISPAGNESLSANFLTQEFQKIGLRVSSISKDPNRPNITGTIGNGEKTIVIACHVDVVAAGQNWNSDPFRAIVKNGKIYGRGAIDDKGPLAISICAVEQFIKKTPLFNGKIILIGMADEEADNEYGIKYLLSQGLRADAALIPDGGYFNKLEIGEKGCLQLIITSQGKQEHSALQEHGKHAITDLIKVINILNSQLVSQDYDPNFTPTKINISKIHGGEIANTIPSFATAQMDIRFPPPLQSKTVLKQIKSLIKNIPDINCKITLEIVYTTEPHMVTDNTLIQTFLTAAKKTQIKMDTITIAGNSVAKEFNQAGIPAIVHYPMNKITAHESDEYIEINKMKKCVELYTNFLDQYFN